MAQVKGGSGIPGLYESTGRRKPTIWPEAQYAFQVKSVTDGNTREAGYRMVSVETIFVGAPSDVEYPVDAKGKPIEPQGKSYTFRFIFPGADFSWHEMHVTRFKNLLNACRIKVNEGNEIDDPKGIQAFVGKTFAGTLRVRENTKDGTMENDIGRFFALSESDYADAKPAKPKAKSTRRR